jgi:hypothetical protein
MSFYTVSADRCRPRAAVTKRSPPFRRLLSTRSGHLLRLTPVIQQRGEAHYTCAGGSTVILFPMYGARSPAIYMHTTT